MKSEEKLKSEVAGAKELLSEYLNLLIIEVRKNCPDAYKIEDLRTKVNKLENKIEAVEWVLSDEPEPEKNVFNSVILKRQEGCTRIPDMNH